MKDIVFLYGLPRSGSTYVKHALAEYLRQTEGFIHLKEFFNLAFEIETTREGLSVNHLNLKSRNDLESFNIKTKLREKHIRLALLKNVLGKYFLKILGFQMPMNSLEGLIPHADLFFVKEETNGKIS